MELSFEYWAREWLKAENCEVKPSTLHEYKKVTNQLIAEFADCDMTDITPKRVQMLLDKMYYCGKSKSTIAKRKYNIQQIFRFANLNGFELTNPCSFVRTPRKAASKQRRVLTKDEIMRVIVQRDKSKYGFYAFFLLFTGLRRSEMLALQWEDIDYNNNVIHVTKVANYINNRVIIDDLLKNGDREKIIPIPDILRRELDRNHRGKRGYIFGVSPDIPINSNSHSWKWELFKRETGLEVTQHMFRHTYCTMLFDAGVDVKTAAYLMGHRDVHTTLSIYTHLEHERASVKAISKLNEYINFTGTKA